MSTRREFVIGVSALLLAARAGAQPRTFRLAYLAASSAASAPQLRQALLARLAEFGYREGSNLMVEYRFAEGHFERLPALAAELAALKPDVFITVATPPTLAAYKATRTIPIVFVAVNDPVRQKIVNSLAHPGANATGLATLAPEYQGKRLQMLKEVLPTATRVAILHNPLNTGELVLLEALKEASGKFGLSLRVIEARSEQDLAPAFKTLESERPDALWVMESAYSFVHRARIAESANRIKLPGVYGLPEFVEAGGLISYSVSLIEQLRAAATYVSKILKGAKPGELPVEQPTKFELVINLKTAKALGLTIPPSLLLRADRVIE